MMKMETKGFSLLEMIVVIALGSSLSLVGIHAVKELKKQFAQYAVLHEVQTSISHESKLALITGKTRAASFNVDKQVLVHGGSKLVHFRKLLKKVSFGSLENSSNNTIYFYPSGSNSAGRITLTKCEIIISRFGAIRHTC